jgi:hypothetical protein
MGKTTKTYIPMYNWLKKLNLYLCYPILLFIKELDVKIHIFFI